MCGQQHKVVLVWAAARMAPRKAAHTLGGQPRRGCSASCADETHTWGRQQSGPLPHRPLPHAHTAAATGAGCTMCPFCSSAAWARTCWPSACGTQRCAAPVWSLLPPALAMACCARTFGAACSPPAPYQDRLSFELAVSGRMYQQAALQPDLRCAAPPAPAMHPTNHSDLRLPNELRPHYTLN